MDVAFNYSFSSGLGCYEHSRFVTNVTLEIVLTDDYGKKEEKIGQVDFLIINIDEARQSPFSLHDILDAHSEYLARHAFEIFDPDEDDFTNKVSKHYQDFLGRNFCLIEKISILPKYRGFNIGAKAIRDIVFHYSASCGLFVLQPFPLQFELFEDGRYDNLGLSSFEQNSTNARKKLTQYYKCIGFESVKGIKDLLFYNPAYKNEAMDGVDLEDPDVFKLKIVK